MQAAKLVKAKRARWGMVAGAMVVVLALGGCGGGGGGGGGGGAADDPIAIGVSLPLTGDFSEPGKGVQRGFEAWAKIVNDGGGLLGRQVELKILDDQSSADRVVADYEQLIGRDQVDLVFGPFSSRLVIPSARVAEEYGMLFVEPAGAAKEVFEQGFKNLFYAARRSPTTTTTTWPSTSRLSRRASVPRRWPMRPWTTPSPRARPTGSRPSSRRPASRAW
jgi:branched-chain amino acid transport system substrate-binding protein